MLHRYSEVFRSLLMLSDLGLVAASWGAAYLLRFYAGVPVLEGWNPDEYKLALLGILPVAFFALRSRGLYEPRRTGSLIREIGSVVGAMTVTLIVILAADAISRTFLSRTVIVTFWALSSASIIGARMIGRAVLRRLRRKGYNLRYVVLVGAGRLAQETIESIHGHPEAGLRVVGVLSDDPAVQGRTLQGVSVLGPYARIKSVLAERTVDQVVIALPREDSDLLEKVLADLDDEIVTVRLIPDLLHVMTLRSSVEDLDGLPVINLREGPMVGWAALQKRAFDIGMSSLLLLAASPGLLAIGLAVWATSGWPVFYRQERMGLDGRLFHMIKFRSMGRDSEASTGAVWASAHDPRVTPLGAFLRKTSLDELPQLWNVLRGDMSLVGPRPERPVFIEQFRSEIPGYMLRHKVKAGMTGWAQIHGWRGNTSLHERVEHDIYYIQNWSLALDLRILFMSVWKGFVNPNAY
ncbi:MAG: undecaprenyl-phosphate glucose phosphotransferase [Deltaproteobacteria bacterium]|jgi:Undecaprenyl-phosphate glucose phosphotransferase|nr:undecaprenyl-phosphate glucose phosphotransferase [Deltaproteobacteria bacterium]